MREVDLFPLFGKMIRARLLVNLGNRFIVIYPEGLTEEQKAEAVSLMEEMEKEYPLTMADFEE